MSIIDKESDFNILSEIKQSVFGELVLLFKKKDHDTTLLALDMTSFICVISTLENEWYLKVDFTFDNGDIVIYVNKILKTRSNTLRSNKIFEKIFEHVDKLECSTTRFKCIPTEDYGMYNPDIIVKDFIG